MATDINVARSADQILSKIFDVTHNAIRVLILTSTSTTTTTTTTTSTSTTTTP